MSRHRPYMEIVAIEGSDASAVKGSEEQLGEQLPPAAPVSAVK